MGSSMSCSQEKRRFSSKKKKSTKKRIEHQPLSLAQTDPSEISIDLEESRVRGWIKDFDILLSDSVGIRIFADFLKKEHSHENIDFWYACEEYKNTEDGKERLQTAEEILERYLSQAATEPVNLNSVCKSNLDAKIEVASKQKPPDKSLFMEAQTQIYNLMKSDSFFRFKNSPEYKTCLPDEELPSYKHYPSLMELERSKTEKSQESDFQMSISKTSSKESIEIQKEKLEPLEFNKQEWVTNPEIQEKNDKQECATKQRTQEINIEEENMVFQKLHENKNEQECTTETEDEHKYGTNQELQENKHILILDTQHQKDAIILKEDNILKDDNANINILDVDDNSPNINPQKNNFNINENEATMETRGEICKAPEETTEFEEKTIPIHRSRENIEEVMAITKYIGTINDIPNEKVENSVPYGNENNSTTGFVEIYNTPETTTEIKEQNNIEDLITNFENISQVNDISPENLENNLTLDRDANTNHTEKLNGIPFDQIENHLTSHGEERGEGNESICLKTQNKTCSCSTKEAEDKLQDIVTHMENAILEMEKTFPQSY